MKTTFQCVLVEPTSYNKPAINEQTGEVGAVSVPIVSVRLSPVDAEHAVWPRDPHGDLQLHSIKPDLAEFVVGGLYQVEITPVKK